MSEARRVPPGGEAREPSETYTLTLRPAGHVVPCASQETVLAAILRSGARVTFGCLGGGCGVCKMRLVSGSVDHGRCSVEVLPDAERASGWFLSCQARPLDDVTVELTAVNKYRVVAAWRW